MTKLAIVVTLLLAGATFGAKMEELTPEEKKHCNELKTAMIDRHLTAETSCLKSLNFKSGIERAEKMSCLVRCQLTVEGVLTPEGHMAKLDHLFDNHLQALAPPSRLEHAKDLVSACVASHDKELDPTDEYCRSYDSIRNCFIDVIMKGICFAVTPSFAHIGKL